MLLTTVKNGLHTYFFMVIDSLLTLEFV